MQEGKKANEAGYLVGYNSPAQFSREYKRHFWGFAFDAAMTYLALFSLRLKPPSSTR